MIQAKLRKAMEAIRGVKLPQLPSEVLLLEQELNGCFPDVNNVAFCMADISD